MPSPFDTTPAEPYSPPPLGQRLSAIVAAAIAAWRNPKQAITPPESPKLKTEPADAPQNKTTDDPAGRSLPDANFISPQSRQWREMFAQGGGRFQRYQDYESMDVGYGEAMLDAFVDSCLVSDDGQLKGFKIDAKGKVAGVLEQIIEDTNLRFFIRSVLRDVLKYGDVWVGWILDEYWNVVDFDSPPPNQMWTFGDEHNRLFMDTEIVTIGNKQVSVGRAFQQKTQGLATVAGWQPFEMVHLKWRASKRSLYSEKSFLEGFRPDYLKLKLIEEALVMHRVTRSSPRLGWTVDVTGKSETEAQAAVDGFLANLRMSKMADGSSQRDTMSVDEDYALANARITGGDGKIYPTLNDVKFFDPRAANLGNLADVEYLRKKMFARIPSEIVGIMADREDISTQDIAASRLYSYAQEQLEQQFLRPLFNMGLALKGFVPQKDDYRIIFPEVQLRTSWRLADASFRFSLSAVNSIEAGIDNRKHVAQNMHGWSDAEWDAHVKQYEEEQKVFAPPETEKLAANSPKTDKSKQNTNADVSAKSDKGKAKRLTQMRKGANST